jgi:hypothetical protein
MDVTINGKQVILHERLSAGENWDLVKGFSAGRAFSEMTFEESTTMLKRFVASWEFDGDPADVEAYRGLDLFREYMPLLQAVGERMSALMAPSKN